MILHRKVDHMGRILLPAELRDALDIRAGDELEVALDGEDLRLRKAAPCCIFCGAEHTLLRYRSKYACGRCRGEISGADGE